MSYSNTEAQFKMGFLHILIAGCIFLLVGLYAFAANSISADIFETETLSAKIDELYDINSYLEVQASLVQSLSSLRERSSELGLQELSGATYIEIKASESLVLRDK